MKKLLIAILFILVTVSGFCAGTTKISVGSAETDNFGNSRYNMVLVSFNAQQIASGVAATPAFTELSDTEGLFSVSTYTPPIPGYCEVDVDLLWDMPADTDWGKAVINIYRNEAQYKVLLFPSAPKMQNIGAHNMASVYIPVAAGDTIGVSWRADTTSAATARSSTTKYGFIRFRVVP